jgi:hypothetical protein
MTARGTDTAGAGVAEADLAPPQTRDSTVSETEGSTEPQAEDSTVSETEDPADSGGAEAPTEAKSVRRGLSISVGVRSLVIAIVIAILAGAVGALAWLYIDAQQKLDAQASESASNARAEKLALDYAVKAATMDFKDLQAWKVNLVAGTSPELNNKLSEAATSMEQILAPLQWSSTAEPILAKVRSTAAGIVTVDCFVHVLTKTIQAPEALQSTATYGITIDTNNNWLITDVGGIGSVVGPR